MEHATTGAGLFWLKPRHTREGWASTDKAKAKIGGQELTYHAALLQGKGEWAFYNSLPQLVKQTRMLESAGLPRVGLLITS